MITGRDNRTMQAATQLSPDITVTLNAAGGPLGIIRAQGADVVKFLQGQLTQDVALLGLSEARLAAWCSAKGRMLASFVVFKNSPEDIVLLCSASVLATTLKRLQMFVMRAQCKLTDASAEFAVQGCAQEGQVQQGQVQQGAQEAGLGEPANTPNLIASYAAFPWAIARNGEIITLRLPDGHHAGRSVPRALRITPKSTPTPTQTLHAQEAADGDSADLAVWQYLEVTAGIASVTAPVAEAFVPQMLNYESVGGVNFKKGCYPGQEVVARSQFRGTLKRRAYIVASAAPLAAGQEVFDSRDTAQPCGMVVNAAPDFGALETLGSLNAAQPLPNAGHWLAIVSMQTSAFDSPQLFAVPYVPSVPSVPSLPATSAATLAAPALADPVPPSPANGTALTLRALPYALLDDI